MSAIEDAISRAGTEDVLLRSENSSETISSTKCSPCSRQQPERKCFAPTCQLITSVLCLVLGLATIVWTPFEILMKERLRMQPGFPAYDWWKDPPDKVIFGAYIFNVTNSEEFLANPDTKLNMVEIGPIIFSEKLLHTNVTFNENGTMTYVATRKAIYLPEMNTINLNSTLIVPNWALLGIASYLSDSSFFTKLGFNLLTKSSKPKQFVKLTIRDALWNFTDPMIDSASKLMPNMVPTNNLGILSRVYSDFTNEVTVYVGRKYGHRNFFLINKYDGSEGLPHFEEYCGGGVTNSTEGVTYPQYITKNTTLKYWRKTFSQVAVLRYQREGTKYGLKTYRFGLIDSSFNRTNPPERDCFKGHPPLPNGLSDLSSCHFGFPIASSFPHFLHGDKILKSYVIGLQPNESKHESFVVLEPLSGVPINARARSQSNLVVRKLLGFTDLVSRFSNTVIPMFWLDYYQTGLPWYIISLMYFQGNILPIFQWFFTGFLWAAGVILLYRYMNNRRRQRLLRNKFLIFEKEPFVGKL